MIQIDNLNIDSQTPLSSPKQIISAYPASEENLAFIAQARQEVTDILNRKDSRKIMIVGPCSIHNEADAIEYAKRLKTLQEKVSDKLLLVMRVYFEKPRTTIGWKGLIYDPDLNDSYDFEKGLRMARKIMRDVVSLGIPTATEMLDPISAQYIADLVCWSAIGARTTESQTHRQLVSGLSMPTGFKNATTGNIQVACEAIKSASHPHSFIGVLPDGRSGLFHTKGNPNCHVVLRGGSDGPNYGSEYIAFCRELMKKAGLTPNIIVDCSHANCNKVADRQMVVLHDLVQQILEGNEDILGFMMESNILGGNQKVKSGETPKAGLSITDPCISWENTESIITEVYHTLPTI